MNSFKDVFSQNNDLSEIEIEKISRKGLQQSVDTMLDLCARQENIQEKMSRTTSREIQAYFCPTCRTWSKAINSVCSAKSHEVSLKNTTEYYFCCARKTCGKRIRLIGMKYPGKACTSCGYTAWMQCGSENVQYKSLEMAVPTDFLT